MSDEGAERRNKLTRFRALHDGPGAFVLPNAWDAGTARLLATLPFAALATTSAGYAFSAGKRDSCAALTRAEILDNAAAIAAATDLPVSADLEDGFAVAPEECADTIAMACTVGLVGGTLEDATGNPDAPIYEMGLAVDRVRAAAEVARNKGFVLTARAENFLWGCPDLGDTIARLQAFGEAGAEVLYAPGLRDLEQIATVCRAVDQPVNVVMGLTGPRYGVAQLAEVGVRRISVGGSFARAALGEMMRAAHEVLEQGSFGYSERALPVSEIEAAMARNPIGGRTG
ncbi:MAG: 2-methylisocitrate lyase [Rhodobacterales bacterium]|nr:MAG: 2-methylisocitrate lyase [Rhodobacterales bacterium]